MRSWIVGIALFAALGARAQPVQEATPEQKARSYVASAFMTGAAPAILSDKVELGPQLQSRLGLPPGADSAKIYEALIGLMQGATPSVRDATAEEAKRFPGVTPPLFTLNAGGLSLLVRYDLQGSNVTFAEQLSGPPVAATAPIAEPAKPEPLAEAPKPVYSVVEPKAPTKPSAKAKAAVKPKVQAKAAPAAEPQLKRNAPCVVKPVMSDQDLVNCGATPPRY